MSIPTQEDALLDGTLLSTISSLCSLLFKAIVSGSPGRRDAVGHAAAVAQVAGALAYPGRFNRS